MRALKAILKILIVECIKGATEPLFTKATYYKKERALKALIDTLLHVSLSVSHIVLLKNACSFGNTMQHSSYPLNQRLPK